MNVNTKKKKEGRGGGGGGKKKEAASMNVANGCLWGTNRRKLR